VAGYILTTSFNTVYRCDMRVVQVVLGYIVYHYCLRFDRGVVHFAVVILSTITV
jgi:hypothetical protein